MLTKKTFAQTDLLVSRIGLGTVKLGRNEGVKYPTAFTIPDDREARQLIATAKALGVNLIDTAPAYGNSEQRLGELLKGERKDWVICSKVGEEFVDGCSAFDFTPEHTRLSIERSLKRLNTDYLDIVLVHSDGNDQNIIEQHGTLDTLAELKQSGLIRAFGMSTKTVEGGIMAARQADCVMVTYNLAQQEEQPVLDYCLKNHKGVFLKKVLASGHLCSATDQDPVQSSMDFVFAHPAVTSAIIGTINVSHLKSNIEKAMKACP